LIQFHHSTLVFQMGAGGVGAWAEASVCHVRKSEPSSA